jgi:hypothetical protein
VKKWPNIRTTGQAEGAFAEYQRDHFVQLPTDGFLRNILAPPRAPLELSVPAPILNVPHTPHPPPPLKVPDPLAFMSAKLGHTHLIFMESFSPHSRMMVDPDRTPLLLRMRAVEVNAIRHRDRGELQALMRLVEGREAIADRLIETLLDEADRLEGDKEQVTNVTHQNARGDTKNIVRPDDRGTEVEGQPGDTGDIRSPVHSQSRAATEGIVASEPTANTRAASNLDTQEDTGTLDPTGNFHND